MLDQEKRCADVDGEEVVEVVDRGLLDRRGFRHPRIENEDIRRSPTMPHRGPDAVGAGVAAIALGLASFGAVAMIALVTVLAFVIGRANRTQAGVIEPDPPAKTRDANK